VSVLYLDTSAFIKTIVREPESQALRAYLAGNPRQVSSVLLKVEALRAVRDLGARFTGAVRTGLRRMDLIALDDRILEAAGTLNPSILRTLDAVHLASAAELDGDLDAIITYDRRMISGATVLGLPVVTPRR
jgi:uncharacterized protein